MGRDRRFFKIHFYKLGGVTIHELEGAFRSFNFLLMVAPLLASLNYLTDPKPKKNRFCIDRSYMIITLIIGDGRSIAFYYMQLIIFDYHILISHIFHLNLNNSKYPRKKYIYLSRILGE